MPPSDGWSASSRRNNHGASVLQDCWHCRLILAQLVKSMPYTLSTTKQPPQAACIGPAPGRLCHPTHSTVLASSLSLLFVFLQYKDLRGPELEHKSTGSKQRQKVSSVGQSEGRPQRARRGGGEADVMEEQGRAQGAHSGGRESRRARHFCKFLCIGEPRGHRAVDAVWGRSEGKT